jgi:hypothetical protein
MLFIILSIDHKIIEKIGYNVMINKSFFLDGKKSFVFYKAFTLPIFVLDYFAIFKV